MHTHTYLINNITIDASFGPKHMWQAAWFSDIKYYLFVRVKTERYKNKLETVIHCTGKY